MKSKLLVAIRFSLVLLACFALVAPALADPKKNHSEGADLVFGGVGNGPGEFTILLDMAFDPKGNLYTLEAGGTVKRGTAKTAETVFKGTARVQKFDSQGKSISEFPLGDDIPTEQKSWPTHLAVDDAGNVYVAVPTMGIVRQYGPDGKKITDHVFPGAGAVAFDATKGRVAAISISATHVVKGERQTSGGEQILLLDPKGGTPEAIQLSQPIHNVNAIAVDKNGSFYIQGGEKRTQIFVFDPKGQLVKSIGSGEMTHNEDGSEPADTVAVDSHGNIYNTGWGNPVMMTMYTADGKSVIQHHGAFHFGQGWNASPHNGYNQRSVNGVILAVAPDDRVWVASMAINDPNGVFFAKYNPTPVVIRTDAKFFDPKVFGVSTHSGATLGFVPSLQCALPFNVTHALAPIQDEFVVAPAFRNVSEIEVTYHVYDYFKNEISGGTSKIPLKDGVEARMPFSFTPPRYGWYIVEVEITSGGEKLMGISQQIGVTPDYPGMPVKPEEFLAGWDDIPRQMFCGLDMVRLSGSKELADLEKSVQLAQKDGVTFSIQTTDAKANFTAEKLRPLVEHFKGQVRYYELFNEPNFSFSPQDFAAAVKPVYQMIKEVDPQAQVMGPSTCGINLGWIEKFFQSGGGDACDIIAVHDYEGHESIIPEHWRWKMGALRDLMQKYGQGKKEVWQTERAIAGVRFGMLLSAPQAIRTALQRNLMATLGVPPEHNNHYYLNQGGYSAVPSYAWDSTGPHAAALTLRTRYAYTLGRKYAGEIDFGPTGKQMLLGLRYEGGDGPVTIVQNLGTADLPIDIVVKGGDAVEMVDSFGNVKSVTATGGHFTFPIPQLPVYFHLKPGQELTFPKLDYGRNIAPAAKITYSGRSDQSNSLLNNGILETYQSGDPNGDTNGTKIWKGEPLAPDRPQYLELDWKTPRSFDSVLLFGPHADNGFCALLDYDLQAWQDGAWKTISQVRTHLPQSDLVVGCKDVLGVTWLEDNNFLASHFAPVTTDRLRVAFLRATYGACPDENGNMVLMKAIGGWNISRPMLREVEVYAPKGPIQLSSSAAQPAKTAAFESDVVKVTVSNTGTQPFQGTVHAIPPEGWTVSPEKAPVNVAAGGTTDISFTVKPPADLPIGNAAFDFEAQDATGAGVDFDVFSFVVTPPFNFHQDPLPVVKDGVQTFPLGVFNMASEPLSGTARLELSGPDKIAPIDMPFGPVEPGKWDHPAFTVPVDLKKGSWTATYSVTANHLTDRLVQNLSQRQWSVVGPFENDFEKVFGPETDILKNKVDITRNYTDTFGGEQKWQVVSDDAAGKLDLLNRFNRSQNATAYAAIWVTSSKARPVLLYGALDGCGKIWVNGKLVVSREKSRGIAWGQDQAVVDLQAGENLVVIKILVGGSNTWKFLFDLLDPETHKPAENLSFSPKSQH